MIRFKRLDAHSVGNDINVLYDEENRLSSYYDTLPNPGIIKHDVLKNDSRIGYYIISQDNIEIGFVIFMASIIKDQNTMDNESDKLDSYRDALYFDVVCYDDELSISLLRLLAKKHINSESSLPVYDARSVSEPVCYRNMIIGSDLVSEPSLGSNNIPMMCFLDMEFTGLHQGTTPISLAIVTDTGDIFYAEFIDYDKTQINQWLNDNVMNNLIYDNYETLFEYDDNDGSNDIAIKDITHEISKALKKWLEGYNRPIQFVCDVGYYDFMLFANLFGGMDLPKRVSLAYHELNQDIASYLNITEEEAFDISRKDLMNLISDITLDDVRHNALSDALEISALYCYISTNPWEVNK